MTSYPVFFGVEQPPRYERAQLALRIVLVALFSLVGVTMGVLFGLLYLGLPLAAAVGLALRWQRLGHGPFVDLFEILASSLFSLGLAVAWAQRRLCG